MSGSELISCTATAFYSISASIYNQSSITWSVTGGLQIKSGQGTNTVSIKATNPSGGGYLRATITASDGITSYMEKFIHVGAQPVESINGPTTVSPGSGVSYSAVPASSMGTYQWTVQPSDGVSQSVWNNGNYITFYTPGYYMISCRAVSACSTGAGSQAYLYVSVESNYYAAVNSKVVTLTNQLQINKKHNTSETHRIVLR